MRRGNLLGVDDPVEGGGRSIGGVRGKPGRLQAEAVLGAVDHRLAAPTSAWRMAREASTSTITPNFTSMR